MYSKTPQYLASRGKQNGTVLRGGPGIVGFYSTPIKTGEGMVFGVLVLGDFTEFVYNIRFMI